MVKKPKKKNWYRLDNTAKLYPAITSTQATSVFRLSATLKKMVEPSLLKKALVRISKRFPLFTVRLKRGFFWYYYEKTDIDPVPEEEKFFPCMFLEYKKEGFLPFRVLYYKRKISLEISHSITDGTGAITFLKSLIVEYFAQKGVPCDLFQGIVRPEMPIEDCESEDSFQHYYKKGLPDPPPLAKAYKLNYKSIPMGEYLITTGIVDVKNILAASKEYTCTVTQYFIAHYFDTLQDLFRLNSDYKQLPVVINIPVNLRNIFPSKTMRNFFAGISPAIDFRLGHYSFAELILIAQNYMKTAITEKKLAQQISYNVQQEKPLWIRVVPLWLKKQIVKIVYRNYGENRMTTSLSNLGDVVMPGEIEDQIDRFEFYPPPSDGTMKKVSMLSYRGKMYISFGSLTNDKTVEKLFFRKLRKAGFAVKIESNGV
ncbi:MAG: hypothetical protein GY714_03485 [Desulfobacterales bacterium]|nr:hypothetical protein [Desulfobacterales bacterium]